MSVCYQVYLVDWKEFSDRWNADPTEEFWLRSKDLLGAAEIDEEDTDESGETHEQDQTGGEGIQWLEEIPLELDEAIESSNMAIEASQLYWLMRPDLSKRFAAKIEHVFHSFWLFPADMHGSEELSDIKLTPRRDLGSDIPETLFHATLSPESVADLAAGWESLKAELDRITKPFKRHYRRDPDAEADAEQDDDGDEPKHNFSYILEHPEVLRPPPLWKRIWRRVKSAFRTGSNSVPQRPLDELRFVNAEDYQNYFRAWGAIIETAAAKQRGIVVIIA